MDDERNICEYCTGWTLPDIRGNCVGCGAPKRPTLLQIMQPSPNYPGAVMHIPRGTKFQDYEIPMMVSSSPNCASTSVW